VRITFVGGGNMAQAIVGGLVKKGYAPNDLSVIEPAAQARSNIERLGARAHGDAHGAEPYGDMLVMAVKPQHMRDAAASVRKGIAGKLVLSIAAGIRLGDLGRWLGGHTLLARCMPNTPALIGEGITGLFCAAAVSPAQRRLAVQALEAVGQVIEVTDEALLDPVTAVSGSGPAYVFLFMEAMQQAARELGLTAGQARALALQTFTGAARLAAESEEDVALLRERVTSKGGTTERALASMRDDHVVEAIVKAIRAANERAHELGAELGRDS
jgi:pyrroline-5-carboxylate reductase